MTRLIGRIVAVSFPLYFIWELAQMPGYVPEVRSWPLVVAFCGLATVGDVVMVVVLWAFGAFVCRNASWFAPPRAGRYALIVVAGIALNTTVERMAVHCLGLWAYRTWQPTLPALGTGMFAVLQPVTLLPLVFWVVHRWQSAQRDRAGSVASRKCR